MDEKKQEAKRKVEALKKQSTETKKEYPRVSKIDEKEILKQASIKAQDNGITKAKTFFSNIKETIKGFILSFKDLDPAIQLCVIVPIVIVLIVIGNKIYTTSKTTSLTCTYTNYSTNMKIDEEVKLIFKDKHIYTQTRQVTYEILNPEIKTLGELETEKRDANKKLNEIAGIKANYKIEDDKLINTVEYNFYRMNDETIEDYGLDENGTIETYKKHYETFDYECKSGK